ncbi:MAG TPA: hypothetical protein DDY13_11550 [Cytophagales bacterium]|nr:hypothetical protein [Cytophagales bacterium]
MIQKLQQIEVIEYIKGHLHDDPFQLLLKKAPQFDFPLKEAVEQIRSRQKSRKKLPEWAENFRLVLPPPLSIEQSSSGITAEFKAGLVQGESIADLTGGMGVDTIAFADRMMNVYYVEQNPYLVGLAKHNFAELGLSNIQIHHADASGWLVENNIKTDWIYLDPARRDDLNQKVIGLQDCSPNVLDMIPQLWRHTTNILIKLSPLIDINQLVRQMSGVKNIWIVAVQNECKEVLVNLQNGIEEEPTVYAMNHQKGYWDEFSFKMEEEKQAEVQLSDPQEYVYEPNVAIMKSGAFKLVAQRFGLKKLSAHTHLYTSRDCMYEFPGRIFRLISILKPTKKEIQSNLHEKKANLAVRNFPGKAEQLKKIWGIKDGGEDYLFATTLQNGKKAVLRSVRLSDLQQEKDANA